MHRHSLCSLLLSIHQKGTVLTNGTLRFGSVVDFKGFTTAAWRHWGCVTPKILENLKNELGEISELDGYDDLNDDDKARLDAAFNAGHVANADIPDSAGKAAVDEDQDDDEEARGKRQKRKVPARKKKSNHTTGNDEVQKSENITKVAGRMTVERKQMAKPDHDDEERSENATPPSDPEDDLVFKGRTLGGISCQEFVRAVRKHARIENKSRDYEYIADYVISCLDGEALHWSETLSTEVQGNWSLLRLALLAEYNTSPFSVVIPSAMIPTPAAAPPIQSMQAMSSHYSQFFPRTPFSNAMFPVSSIMGVVPAAPPPVTIQTNVSVKGLGRICVKVGPVSYYVAIREGSAAMCVATRAISKAATVESIDTGGGIELQFVSPGSRSGNWLGMVWESNPIKIGSYAALIPATRQGSSTAKADGIPNSYWEGEVGVAKWTRSGKGVLTPVRGANPGVHVVVIQISRANGHNFLYVANNLKSFPSNKSYTSKGVQLIFEPL